MEKAFDGVPRDDVWWALGKLGIEMQLFKRVQSMHRSARSCVGVNETFSDDFLVQIRLHEGLVLSPLLFIIAMEALS